MAFSSGVYRWAYGHAASKAAFLADATNIIETGFSWQTGEPKWLVKCANLIIKGTREVGLNSRASQIGNYIPSPFEMIARPQRQYEWLLTNRFNSGDPDALATINIWDQALDDWRVFTVVVTRPRESPDELKTFNNKYLGPLTFTFSEASELT